MVLAYLNSARSMWFLCLDTPSKLCVLAPDHSIQVYIQGLLSSLFNLSPLYSSPESTTMISQVHETIQVSIKY